MTSYWDSSKARGYVQPGGAGYGLKDLGVETNIAAITGFGASYESDYSYDGYVGTRKTSNFERGTGQIMSRRTYISQLRNLTNRNCLFNLYVLNGCVGVPTLSEFEWGVVYLDGGVTSGGVDQNLAQGMEQFDPKTNDIADVTYGQYVELFSVVHNSISAALNTASPLVKIIRLTKAQCPGYCGPDDDGNQKFIILGSPISPATLANVFYTDDGGLTWTSDTIAGAVDVTSASSVTVAGNYVLFALSGTNGGVYYETLDNVAAGTVTGTLANGIPNGTNVTSIFAVDSLNVYAATSVGVVYKSVDGGFSWTQIATDSSGDSFVSIHGRNTSLLYFVGSSGNIAKLANDSFIEMTDPSGGDDLLTVHVPAGQTRGREVFVGTSGGDIWYSTDAGTSWVAKSFPGSGTGTVDDIQSSEINSIALFFLQGNAGGTASRAVRDLTGGQLGVNAQPIGDFTTTPNSTMLSIAPTSANTAMVVGPVNSGDGFVGKIQPN